MLYEYCMDAVGMPCMDAVCMYGIYIRQIHAVRYMLSDTCRQIHAIRYMPSEGGGGAV